MVPLGKEESWSVLARFAHAFVDRSGCGHAGRGGRGEIPHDPDQGASRGAPAQMADSCGDFAITTSSKAFIRGSDGKPSVGSGDIPVNTSTRCWRLRPAAKMI
jgi:hypothetical protein